MMTPRIVKMITVKRTRARRREVEHLGTKLPQEDINFTGETTNVVVTMTVVVIVTVIAIATVLVTATATVVMLHLPVLLQVKAPALAHPH